MYVIIYTFIHIYSGCCFPSSFFRWGACFDMITSLTLNFMTIRLLSHSRRNNRGRERIRKKKLSILREPHNTIHNETEPEGLPELNTISCTHKPTCVEMCRLLSMLRPHFLYNLILNHLSSISTSISLHKRICYLK